MRLAWLTDIHLNFVDRHTIEVLADEVRASQPDVVLIGGDIGHAHSVQRYLDLLSSLLRLPIYFVLGNHDYYEGSIASVRADMTERASRTRNVTWLTISGPISLTAHTALIGHDGWGDGGFGNARTSPVVLNDFLLIEELAAADRPALLAMLGKLGAEAATHLRTSLEQALLDHAHVVALTHVPPFREAAWYEGRHSDENWLPYFACRAAGEVLGEVMARHPGKRLTVLCGHTHGAGHSQVLPNLEVVTGGAEYGRPRLQQVIEVD